MDRVARREKQMKGIVIKKTDKDCTIQVDGQNQLYTFGEKVKPEYVILGSCEFTEKDSVLSFIKKADFVTEGFKTKEDSKDSDKNWKDDMVNFESLLSDAHHKFKKNFNIKTEMISVDYEKSRCIFSACVSVEDGDQIRVFTGHGDAEGIQSTMIKPHFIRMAETRAIARALRWATNNATCAEEEK